MARRGGRQVASKLGPDFAAYRVFLKPQLGDFSMHTVGIKFHRLCHGRRDPDTAPSASSSKLGFIAAIG